MQVQSAGEHQVQIALNEDAQQRSSEAILCVRIYSCLSAEWDAVVGSCNPVDEVKKQALSNQKGHNDGKRTDIIDECLIFYAGMHEDFTEWVGMFEVKERFIDCRAIEDIELGQFR